MILRVQRPLVCTAFHLAHIRLRQVKPKQINAWLSMKIKISLNVNLFLLLFANDSDVWAARFDLPPFNSISWYHVWAVIFEQTLYIKYNNKLIIRQHFNMHHIWIVQLKKSNYRLCGRKLFCVISTFLSSFKFVSIWIQLSANKAIKSGFLHNVDLNFHGIIVENRNLRGVCCWLEGEKKRSLQRIDSGSE